MARDVRVWERRWKKHGVTLDQFRAWLCNKTEDGWVPLRFRESMYPKSMRR